MFYFAAYPSPFYAILFTISFYCWLGFEIWVFLRNRSKDKKKTRGGGWVILALILGISFALNMPAIAPGFNIQSYFTFFFVLGIAFIWGGLLFRFWSILTLGRYFSTSLMIQQEHKLITSGPYRYLRNPSYTRALVTFLGIGLGIGNWLSVALLFIITLDGYIFRIRLEEQMLLERFDRVFEDYKKGTRALIPYIW